MLIRAIALVIGVACGDAGLRRGRRLRRGNDIKGAGPAYFGFVRD